jgi:hypothetical protein
MVKTTELKEYKIDFKTFIGGWYISSDICKQLINYFNDNSENISRGHIGKDNDSIIDKDRKDSFDMTISANDHNGIIGTYREQLQNVLLQYIIKYPHSNRVQRYAITQDYNLQKYPKDGGFKAWHCENEGSYESIKRHLVFMTYLNTVEKGGTAFYHQKIITPAQTGLTLIWPAQWTHTHKGQVSNKQEKYIATGWFNYV